MRHLQEDEEQLELGIFFEHFLKKKNYLKNLLATSFFEIDLLFFYIEYD
tara:strand:- start:282 stop:428 length:147 start_codon:yes stop_codon:yes gene_type:complete